MKKLLSIFSAAVLVVACMPFVSALTYNYFAYEVIDAENIKITGYGDLHTENVYVPAQIDGIPVTAIGDNVFKSKYAIKTVVIPASITEIGANAFYDCRNLSSLVMGTGVKKIGSHCFTNCKALNAVNLQNIEEISEYSFYGCSALEQLNMGSALKIIGRYSFYGCKLLNMIRFSQVLESIGDYAFYNCIAVESFVFPDSLNYIGNSAFAGCKKLASVTFGKGELDIAGYAFENCEVLTAVTLPANIKSIGRYAFAMRDETLFNGKNIEITCTGHSAGFAYCFGTDIEPTVSDYGSRKVKPGNVDGKGGITTDDARAALAIAAQLKPADETQLLLADVNGNGWCDTTDARMILQKAIGVYKV